jgi:hypothetical protein
MVDIDGEDLQETSLSGGRDSVRGVVRVGPRIGPMRKATIRKVVYYALVRVLLGTHKNQADGFVRYELARANVYSLLERMGTAGVIKYCVM